MPRSCQRCDRSHFFLFSYELFGSAAVATQYAFDRSICLTIIAGAYGVVCAAKNKDTGAKVAIKKITPMCSTAVDGKHTLREIRLMRHLGRHPNIISLKDLVVNPTDDELYVVMELMDTDLHRIIQSPQPLGDAHFKHFLYQLLRGLRFAHGYGAFSVAISAIYGLR